MIYLKKGIKLILFFIFYLSISEIVLAKDTKIKYSKGDIANYFSGIISLNQNYTIEGYNFLNKADSLKNKHYNYNIQFIRSLVLLDKFKEAFSYSRKAWNENEYFFEADLLLGIDSFLNEDFSSAEKYFLRANKISPDQILFEDFFGNMLLSWVKAKTNNKEESYKILDRIPRRYNSLKKIQNSFLKCYFDNLEAETSFSLLVDGEKTSISRYDFFTINYLVHKNKISKAKKAIKKSIKNGNNSLLIKQTENFILNKEFKKIKNLFDCRNPRDSIAEMFYVVANLYATQGDFKLSNFYLRLSLFLNEKFTPNKILLAENFTMKKNYLLAKKTYKSVKKIGKVYSWYASINNAIILSETGSKEESILSLKKDFKLIKNPNFENYFEFANFLRDQEKYEEAIKYYTFALENINKDDLLLPKILDRRGTSYERLGLWDKAEKDLLDSIKIKPDEPHVLNYLAYSWVDKGINIEKSIEMLKKANELKNDDGYIIDSLGWAYYMNENYLDAEKYLQRAVTIMPLDPVINDHYADALWMLDKTIQARYFWKHALRSEEIEEKLKKKINKKLIFGIKKKI